MKIFIHRDGQEMGPFTVAEARDFFAKGNLVEGDLAKYEGTEHWVLLGQMAEIALQPSLLQAPDWVPPKRSSKPKRGFET